MTRLNSELVVIEALLPDAVFQVMSHVVAHIHPVLQHLLRAAPPSALSSTLVAVWQKDQAVVVVAGETYRQLPQVTVVDS